jgi:hypothetical protein
MGFKFLHLPLFFFHVKFKLDVDFSGNFLTHNFRGPAVRVL